MGVEKVCVLQRFHRPNGNLEFNPTILARHLLVHAPNRHSGLRVRVRIGHDNPPWREAWPGIPELIRGFDCHA